MSCPLKDKNNLAIVKMCVKINMKNCSLTKVANFITKNQYFLKENEKVKRKMLKMKLSLLLERDFLKKLEKYD